MTQPESVALGLPPMRDIAAVLLLLAILWGAVILAAALTRWGG